MSYRQRLIAEVSALAHLTISADRIMPAAETLAARSLLAAGFETLRIETTAIRVLVTIACYMNIS